MRIELPSWPAYRLVYEAVLTFNMRHLRDQLDAESSPWIEVHNAVLKFLRHRLSSYDQQLHDHATFDQEYRDELAAEIRTAAYRKYDWLRKDVDPRPLPEPPQSRLFFDRRASELADLHTIKDQLHSAIRDLRCAGVDRREEIQSLQLSLAEIEQEIDEKFCLFRTEPATKGTGNCLLGAHNATGYYFGGRKLSENYTRYAGFRCPNCRAAVMRTKQAVACGQGRRMIAFSCHCLAFSVDPPGPGYALKPVTLERWAEFCGRIKID